MTDPLERRQAPQAHPLARALAVATVMLVLSSVSLIAMAVMMVRLNALVEENRRGNAYIIECTTPGPKPPPDTGHPCFDAGQARTGAAVAEIVGALKGAKP